MERWVRDVWLKVGMSSTEQVLAVDVLSVEHSLAAWDEYSETYRKRLVASYMSG